MTLGFIPVSWAGIWNRNQNRTENWDLYENLIEELNRKMVFNFTNTNLHVHEDLLRTEIEPAARSVEDITQPVRQPYRIKRASLQILLYEMTQKPYRYL